MLASAARRRCRSRGAAGLVVVLLACAAPPSRAATLERAPAFAGPVRGIMLSTHMDGRDWAWDGAAAAFDRIRSLGGNWVAIHPYASIRADGSVRFAPIDPDDPPAHLVRPIAEAHRRGLRIMIVPHLAYWGSPFRWRGEIGFEDDASWRRYWRDYRAWIVSLARATRDADGFSIGNEAVRTLGFEAQWRALIRDVRRATPAPLTYAANWDEYEQVPFWDALDAIGIQAYFPLTDETDTSERAIRAGWTRWMERLDAFSRARGRPVLFTELGYNHSHAAPVRPWEGRDGGEDARAVQATCLRVALEAVAASPRVRGVFLWKLFPEPRPLGRNFQLAVPEIERVISGAWHGQPAEPEPAPGR